MGGSVRYGANEQPHKEGDGRFESACVHICAELGSELHVLLQFQACRRSVAWASTIGHCRLRGLHPGLLFSAPPFFPVCRYTLDHMALVSWFRLGHACVLAFVGSWISEIRPGMDRVRQVVASWESQTGRIRLAPPIVSRLIRVWLTVPADRVRGCAAWSSSVLRAGWG